MKAPIKRCAIYTRKSSEEGLEQEFNSLHAQRESCMAYIVSQKSEGWTPVKTHYDDGRFSGGNTDRPALKQLMEDIKARKIDIVVVYKIDRLTRSLTDFSKLVEVFDEFGVTFVSVTQSFNTTTSMGRLTLNVLLSFAQFEREVTGERIRDKIAASKKKGMWMGGTIPLGYDVEGRNLIVNQKEADIIRLMCQKYLELGSVSSLKIYLDGEGIKTKAIDKEGRIRGGRLYSRGNLYLTLTNPLYVGKVRHKKEVYDGLQEGIVDIDVWERVQLMLQNLSIKPRKSEYKRIDKPLSRKIYDCEGNIYTPAATSKNNKRYGYYVSQSLLQSRNHPNNVIGRIPAEQMESVVNAAVKNCIISPIKVKELLDIQEGDNRLSSYIQEKFKDAWLSDVIKKAVLKIVVNTDTLELHMSKKALASLLSEKLDFALPICKEETHTETIPFHTRRGDRVTIVTAPSTDKADPFAKSPKELKNWVRGIVWRDEFYDGNMIEQIAKRENLSARYVGRLIDASLNL